MNNYYLVNKSGKGLSAFYPNDERVNPLRFMKNNVFSYPSIEEAEKHLQYIINNTPIKYRKTAFNLRVSMYAKGF